MCLGKFSISFFTSPMFECFLYSRATYFVSDRYVHFILIYISNSDSCEVLFLILSLLTDSPLTGFHRIFQMET